jgi:hypothetical protein
MPFSTGQSGAGSSSNLGVVARIDVALLQQHLRWGGGGGGGGVGGKHKNYFPFKKPNAVLNHCERK